MGSGYSAQLHHLMLMFLYTTDFFSNSLFLLEFVTKFEIIQVCIQVNFEAFCKTLMKFKLGCHIFSKNFHQFRVLIFGAITENVKTKNKESAERFIGLFLLLPFSLLCFTYFFHVSFSFF